MNVLTPGSRFGDYETEDVIGHGGWAVVYRAHHCREPAVAVAVKVLDDRHRAHAQLARLAREFDFASRLIHPHVIAMYDRGPEWLAMALVGGGTAAEMTSTEHRLRALADVADALDYAHDHGVIHCDVKPANILIADDFAEHGAVLIDFGVASSLTDQHRRLTHIEASLPYAAPELLQGRPPSAATDGYALACTAVELLIGSPPFRANTAMGLVDLHLNGPVPRYAREIAWVPHAFDSILAKQMAKDPDRRYQRCSEFIALIAKALR